MNTTGYDIEPVGTVRDAGINCEQCGRFVGKDGQLETECSDWDGQTAVVSGTCRRCLDKR